ncbi:MAG: hypothetical protein V4549_06680 [Bacteroidota bacterium]
MGADTITVEKNGIQDEMNRIVWESIGADNNKDGWRRVVNEPIEVVQIKSKKAEAAKVAQAEEVSPEGEVKQEELVDADVEVTPAMPMKAKEVKPKTGKKK